MRFDPYVIFAGKKHRMITSRRADELKTFEEENGQYVLYRKYNPRDLSSNHTRCSRSPQESKYTWYALINIVLGETWEFVTLIGASMAAIGFTIQFIGLRGLAYPCAIAHLLAIIIMAATRAFVRRRLGHPLTSTSAIEGHELDFLALHIVFCNSCQNGELHTEQQSKHESDLVSRWGVKTITPGSDDVLYIPFREELDKQIKPDSEDQGLEDPEKVDLLTSDRLLRVRKRLGDLSHWKTKASPVALSLVNSIETFMNTFFPPSSTKTPFPVDSTKSEEQEGMDWLLETFKPDTNGNMQTEFINIPIKRLQGAWKVDSGRIAAVLALWMASIDARTRLRPKSPQGNHGTPGVSKEDIDEQDGWRRNTTELDLNYKFCRVLGDDYQESILKRDLSWWVDGPQVCQIEEIRKDGTVMPEADIIVGFNGRQGLIPLFDLPNNN